MMTVNDWLFFGEEILIACLIGTVIYLVWAISKYIEIQKGRRRY